VQRVGLQQFARQPAALAPFVTNDQQVDDDRRDHDAETERGDLRERSASEPVECGACDFNDDQQEEDEDSAGGERFVLAVSVRMIVVGRLQGGP
jgi:hypothetical protein